MASALASAAGTDSPQAFTLVDVPHSFATLENLTMQLDSDKPSLSARGIDIVSWAPDPTTNTVRVELANYTSTAAALLHAAYASGTITVVPAPATLPQRDSNRYFDTPPFYDGDRILFDNQWAPGANRCTAAFAYTGNRSGTTFGITAGHCGGGSVWTNYNSHFEMGPITTNYFSASSGWDMETFTCNCQAPVWYDPPSITAGQQGSTHHVIGNCYCGVGQLVTMDGATTGEVPDNTVDVYDGCQTFNDGITTCHLSHAYNSAGNAICQPGDSGGPVYQRAPNNNVYAVGLIVGQEYVNDCYYHVITDVWTKVNGTIKTG